MQEPYMLRVVVALVLVAAGSALAADSSDFQLRDASDLVRVCSVPRDHPMHDTAIGFCHGILTGAFRYYESTVKKENRFVCAPNPTPTRAKVMGDFVAWSAKNGQHMKDQPIDALFRYLAEAYPCKK